MKSSVIKYTTSCTFLLCCWYSIWAFSYFLCSMNNYRFNLDTLLTPEEHNVVINSIKEWGMRNSFGSSLTTHLFRSFPYIDSVSARLLPSGLMHCTIKAGKPLWHINHTHLLLSDNTLIDAQLYDHAITQELPAITIPSESTLQELIPVIAIIPQHLTYNYDIIINLAGPWMSLSISLLRYYFVLQCFNIFYVFI